MLILLEIICMCLGIIGTILISIRNKLAFVFYIPGNILWTIYGIITYQYFFTAQYIFYTIMATAALVNWVRLEKEDKNEGS